MKMNPLHHPRTTPRHATRLAGAFGVALAGMVQAGPYSAALGDPLNPYDAPVPGFVGPHGTGKARVIDGFDDQGEPVFLHPHNFVNPLFFSWPGAVADYQPSASISPAFSDPALALGPVTGDNFLVVSLGDLSSEDIQNGAEPGSITLELERPIRNLSGVDFVVFENGHLTLFDQGGAGAGGIFGELAHVEVSANGEDFVRFRSRSLTASPAGPYGSIDPTLVHNLAGKHVNGYGDCWGTPFDLAEVGFDRITHIRLVDVPGDGSFEDSEGAPIYDAWMTFGSGGFDLDAVGGISSEMHFADWPQLARLEPSMRGPLDDPDGDGVANLIEYAFARLPWMAEGRDKLPTLEWRTDGGGPTIQFGFVRDERLVDLVYEIQSSATLGEHDWITVARAEGGSPVSPIPGQTLTVFEEPLPGIKGIEVLRKVTLTAQAPPASQSRVFYRVKVSETPNLLPLP